MSNFAPRYITDKLKDLTPNQIEWYLTRGEPQVLCGGQLIGSELKRKFYPGLRGIVIGKECPDGATALEEARQAKERMLERDLEPFDEIAMGMDTEAIDLQTAFDENLLRIERMTHIGTMQDGSPTEILREIIEDMDLDDIETRRIPEGLEFLTRLDEEDLGADEIFEALRDEGLVGFLLEVSTPSREYHKDGKSASIRYGIRHTHIVYGANFRQACERGLAWARKLDDEKRGEDSLEVQ